MDRDAPKSDALRLGVLAGLCLLIGVQQIHKPALINPDGVFYLSLAQRLPGDYVSVARTYPPGYPCILWMAHGAARFLVGSDSARLWLDSSQRVTVLCQMLALFPLYFLGKLLVGGGRSFWALLILLVLPYPAQFACDVLREWPHVLFLGLGFWLLYWALHRRQWWALALVGLDAGLGYLVRPECVQLVLYGFLALAAMAYGKRGHSTFSAFARPAGKTGGADEKVECPFFEKKVPVGTLGGAGILLAAGFLVPAAANVLATGVLVPHQLRPILVNYAPPAIGAKGSEAARDDLPEFEIAENELWELPIHPTDPDGQPLTFSLVGVPVGSRPVYRFWSMNLRSRFWTANENERRRLLSTRSRSVWNYEGIAFYAYPRADARAGLRGVHRFWSPGQSRHLYTMDEREKQTILQDSSGTWQYEGVAFYAFGEDSRPADTVPVYRRAGRARADSWEPGTANLPIGSLKESGDAAFLSGMRKDANQEIGGPGRTEGEGSTPSADTDGNAGTRTVAWYVHPAGDPPAGAAIRDGVLRWQPGAGQAGEYQFNIIVDDGGLQHCQLVKIRVRASQEKRGHSTFLSKPGAPAAGHANGEKAECPLFQGAGLELLPEAVDRAFDGVAENLMVVFFVPWLLGLYWRLRYQARRTERVLIAAVVAVNLALILGRHSVFGPGDDRRYSLGMIALTIFYVPVGIEVMARWLSYLPPLPRLAWTSLTQRQSAWFHGLMAVGIVVCLPKLVLPSPGNKAGYLAAAEWLQQHTKASDVVAVPDIRIGFYGQRQGLFYGKYPDSRQADYVVVIGDGGGAQVPAQWRREYSVPVDRRSKKTLTIYSTGQSREDLRQKPQSVSFTNDCGLRIADCGLRQTHNTNPQSAIRNPQLLRD